MSNPQRRSSNPAFDDHVPAAEPPSAARQQRYEEAASLLQQWMEAEDGYDDEVWPLVEEELSEIRMRCGAK